MLIQEQIEIYLYGNEKGLIGMLFGYEVYLFKLAKFCPKLARPTQVYIIITTLIKETTLGFWHLIRQYK